MGQTRSQLKFATENGAELTQQLKETLPKQLQNVEFAVTTACTAVVFFCLIASISMVAIALKR